MGVSDKGALPTPLDWDSLVQQLSNVHSNGLESETEAKTRVLSRAILFELQNYNDSYQRLVKAEHSRAHESSKILQCYGAKATAANPCLRLWQRWRGSDACKVTYMALTYPEYSRLAWALNLVIIFAIVWSTAAFCVETVQSIADSDNMTWLTATEYICLALFTVEFLGRLGTCPSLLGFVTSFMNIIDFMAIFPSYIDIALQATGTSGGGTETKVMRLIRLFRVLRLLRVWSRFENVQVIIDALMMSVDVLVMLFFLLIVILICTAAVIYYMEVDTNPNISSIPQAMYYIQTTLTTTGYGDVTPITWQGRAVAGVLMLTAIVTLALPISVVGANFTNMWTDYKTMREAAARSQHVWENLSQLIAQMGQHRSVLEDVAGQAQQYKRATEQSLETVLAHSRAARLVYLTRVTQGKGPGWQDDIQRLEDLISNMSGELDRARLASQCAEVMSDVGVLTHLDEFVSKLDRVHLAYKSLRKWFDEGVVMAEEARLLGDEISHLKKTLASVNTDT